LFRALEQRTGQRQDSCVLDTFMAAVHFMEGGEARPWWSFTAERKRLYGPASSSCKARFNDRIGPCQRTIPWKECPCPMSTSRFVRPHSQRLSGSARCGSRPAAYVPPQKKTLGSFKSDMLTILR
jgi:hypothetical protein